MTTIAAAVMIPCDVNASSLVSLIFAFMASVIVSGKGGRNNL